MRLTPLVRIALFPLVVAVATGCFYGPHHFYGYPGNIFVSWTFAGATCPSAVAQVSISILNDPTPIQPNTFACRVGSPPNQLAVYNFAAGSYVLSLSGLDATGAVIWQGSSTVVVNGDVSGTIDLQPVTPRGPTSIANLSWTFEQTVVGSFFPPCTATGDADPDRIDSVALYVDGSNNPAQTYACTDGAGTGQVSTPSLAPGSHSLQLVAFQTGLSYPFAQSSQVTVNFVANTPATQAFTLDWLVGGIGVTWTYPNTTPCSTVSSVSATFDGGYSMSSTCGPVVVPFKRLPATTAVSYQLTVDALGTGNPAPVVYSGTQSAVTVQPGIFYDPTATVVTVPLN